MMTVFARFFRREPRFTWTHGTACARTSNGFSIRASIAIVGASQDLTTISGQPLKHLTSHGYTGRLYPVNPRYPEIAGVKCYAVARGAAGDAGSRAGAGQRRARRRHAAPVRQQRRAVRDHLQLRVFRGRRRAASTCSSELAAIAREFDIGVDRAQLPGHDQRRRQRVCRLRLGVLLRLRRRAASAWCRRAAASVSR